MLRTLVDSAAPSLLPLLVLALATFAAWLGALVARHIRDKRLAAAVTLLGWGAAGVVADLAQHLVDALKDPSKPGTWSDVAGAAVRQRGLAMLRALYPFAVECVTGALRDPAKVDALLGTLLERAVVELKAKAPPQLAAAEAIVAPAVEPVVLARDTVAPPAPIAPDASFDPYAAQDVTEASRELRRRDQAGSARLAVLLLIVAALALAAVLGLPLVPTR
jgi:hypothetical protein